LRENFIQQRGLQDLKICFLKCDKKRNGQIERGQYLKKLVKHGVTFPEHFLINLLKDLQLD